MQAQELDHTVIIHKKSLKKKVRIKKLVSFFSNNNVSNNYNNASSHDQLPYETDDC